MNPTKIRCPHCGNSILIKQSGKSVCPSCGTPLYIEEKDKSVNVNVTLGNIEKSEAKQKGFFLALLAFILLSVFFMLFLPAIFRTGRKVQKAVAPKYETSLHDPVLTRLFAEAFEKDPASITEEDYARVKTISFQRELSGLQWLKVGFTDDSEKRIPLVYDERTVEIDGTDFQVFPNLEGLYVGETATGGDVRLSYESEEYAHNLANLTKLKYLHLSERSSYDRTPKELAAFVANPAQIEELNGVSLYDAEDVEELVKYFPNLKKLIIVDRGADVSLAGLKQLSQLELLATELRADGNEDLLELTGVKEMEILARADGNPVKDFRFLSGLTGLRSLTLVGATELKSLNALSPLTELEALRIYDARELLSIEPLRGFTALRVLDIGDSTALENLDALQSLTALRKLRLTNSAWGAKTIPPDLSMLTSLEEAEIEEDSMASVAACRSLKKLTIYMNHFGEGSDFSQLAGLENLESLRLNVSSSAYRYTNIERLSALPKLRTLKLVGDEGPLPLKAFPQVTEIEVIGKNVVADFSNSKLVIDPLPDSENTALERLTVIGFEGIQSSPYGSEQQYGSDVLSRLSYCTSLRELRLIRCGLTDLNFVSAVPNVEVLDIGENRIEDISPLTALPKLRALYCGDNEIQNIAVMRDRGILLLE